MKVGKDLHSFYKLKEHRHHLQTTFQELSVGKNQDFTEKQVKDVNINGGRIINKRSK